MVLLPNVEDAEGSRTGRAHAVHAVFPLRRLELDIDLARQETAGCHRLIHLDNAGAALPPDCVTETFIAALQEEAEIGSYRSARKQTLVLQETYSRLAQLLNCSATEIALVESGSRASDLAFSIIQFPPGSLILTTEYEYANNYITMLRASRRGDCRIEFVELDENGDISLEHLSTLIDALGKHIRLISITHVPTHNGIINPIEKIGRLISQAKRSGALPDKTIYMVDACQSAGQMPIDVREVCCDALTICSRKFLRGPRGVAAIYFRKETLEREIASNGAEPTFLNIPGFTWVREHQYEMRSDGRCFESWESNYSAKAAFGRAIDYYIGMNPLLVQQYVTSLADYLRSILRDVRGISLTDVGVYKSALVTFSATALPASHILRKLEANDINISVIDRRTAHINMNKKQQHFVLRASVHYYNTREEIERFARFLDENARHSN
jgi:selenocysteine lyase/cysteine desulfurase